MALINCPDCNHQVSDAAPACPSCGRPIAGAAEAQAAGAPLQTVQETSKRLKAHTLLGWLLILAGGLMAWGATKAMETAEGGNLGVVVALGLYAMLGGLVWLIVTRIRIWWHHK